MRFNRRFFSVPDHVDNADQRKRAQLLQVRGADMRGHCRDCRDRRAGGVQAIDKAGDVAGKPRNIAVAHETEHMGDIGMNDNDVGLGAELRTCAQQRVVIICRRRRPEAADETDASRLVCAHCLVATRAPSPLAFSGKG